MANDTTVKASNVVKSEIIKDRIILYLIRQLGGSVSVPVEDIKRSGTNKMSITTDDKAMHLKLINEESPQSEPE